MIRGACLAISLSLVSACATTSTLVAQQAPAQVLVLRARALDAEGRHDLAADNWRQLLLIQPGQAEALAALVRYAQSIGDQPHVQQYERALRQVQPGAVPSSAAQVPTITAVEDMLREAGRLSANHDYAGALAIYQKAFGSAQPPDNWAVAYYETEAAIPASQEHAVAALRVLSRKYPANPSYQLALGRILTYRPATRLEGARMLSQIHGSATQNEQARGAWRQAILWDVNAPVARETGREYLERFPDNELANRLAGASQKELTAKSYSPVEAEAYKALAAGDLDLATSQFTALASEAGHAGQGQVGLGYVSMKKKQFADAVGHFEQARSAGAKGTSIEKALRDARYWSAMSNGNAALAANDEEAAAAEFGRARALNNAAPEATEALGGTLLADKEPQQAETVFADELKANPHRADAWLGWMSAALDAGHAQELLSRQKAMAADVHGALASRPDYLALLALAELATGDPTAADRILDRLDKSAASANAQSGPAMVKAAGLLLEQGYSDRASRLCVAAIKADHGNAQAWQTLVEAEFAAGRSDSALQVAVKMPTSVDAASMKNADFLVALAGVYQSEQHFATAASLLEHAAGLDGVSSRSALAIKMQMASLAMSQGDPHKAYSLYQTVARQYPANADAWSGMIGALHEGKHDPEALAVIEKLNSTVTGRLRHDPAFLQTAAFVYSENGRSREAMLCLAAVTRYYDQQQRPIPFSVDTEYAWLLLNSGRDSELVSVLDRLGKTPAITQTQLASVEQIWMTWSSRRAEAAYKAGDPRRALAILQAAQQAFPREISARIALANMYVRTGSPNAAYRIFLQMDWQNASVDQYQAAIDSALAANNISHAEFWLKLGLEQHPDDPALLRAGGRVEEQKGNLKQAMRYLRAARDGGTPGTSDETLAAALPSSGAKKPSASADVSSISDPSPQSALLRLLGGTPSRSAGSVQDLPGGSTASFTIDGPQPAMRRLALESEKRVDPVSATLPPSNQSAEPTWPGEPATLPAAKAPSSVSPGDPLDELFKPAESNKPSKESDSDPLAGIDLSARSEAAAPSANDMVPDAQPAAAPSDTLESLLRGASPKNIASFADSLDPAPATSSSVAEVRTTNPIAELLGSQSFITPTQQQADTDLAALESRYSPWMGTGASVREHSGTTGFDNLVEYDAEIEGSTVIAGAARFTAISRPIQIQSGTPDLTSNYRFGSGSTSPSTPQFASGLGFEAQLATRSLLASIGTSPTSFAVPNAIGSIAFRHGQGPITFRVYRENVKDTMLSYAGMTDPATGRVWGGVVGSGAALDLSRGGAESGFYATIAGEKLTGRNVTNNTRVFGNAGAYWLAYSNPYGALKVGANITAMHYSLNERFFTFGQGGYFSPNGFLTINAPITWESRPIYNTYYTVTGSLGAQNIQQGQATPGSLILGNGVETTTGAGFDLHARVVHRFGDHWNLEAFLETNNAHQYTERATGFSVRYMKFAPPADLPPSGFANQTEIRPLQQP